jgi:hypothetical protein
MSNYNYPKKVYKAAAAAVDNLKRVAIALHDDFSEQACKAGFDSLSELLRVYDAFANSEYDIK